LRADVGDLAVGGETGVGARMDRRPADDLVALVGQHAGRALLHELTHVLTPRLATDLTVDLAKHAIAEAPAHVRVGTLGAEHGADVLEPGGGTDLDGHGESWIQAGTGR
jgi:hypothetical protein